MSSTAKGRWPTTLPDAISVLELLLSEADKAAIQEMPEGDLLFLHMRLGAFVRNEFGLWEGNQDLLKATGERDADSASMVILRAFWEYLRARPSFAFH